MSKPDMRATDAAVHIAHEISDKLGWYSRNSGPCGTVIAIAERAIERQFKSAPTPPASSHSNVEGEKPSGLPDADERTICERCGEYSYDCLCPPIPVLKEADVSAGKATGQKWPEYVCRYYHDGAWWSLNLSARDHADAERRVAKLGNLQLLGMLKMTTPARSGAWLPNLICRIRNQFNR